MHKTPHKIDKEATREARFYSKHSYVSMKLHHGTDHQCVYLAGLEDIGARRHEVFMRDDFRCVACGARVDWHTGDLSHKGNTKVSRCWCMENLECVCRLCRRKHHHGRDF
jgi:hypothetical protein